MVVPIELVAEAPRPNELAGAANTSNAMIVLAAIGFGLTPGQSTVVIG
jgi:hypothetical protein